jgi:predicted nuclease of predicted toxin-antitoxin system
MRLLADESCERSLIAALRSRGFDVRELGEAELGTADERLLQMAYQERRILLTEDKDFGNLVYANDRVACGIILVRARVGARSEVASLIHDLVVELAGALHGSFVVVEAGRTQVRPLS